MNLAKVVHSEKVPTDLLCSELQQSEAKDQSSINLNKSNWCIFQSNLSHSETTEVFLAAEPAYFGEEKKKKMKKKDMPRIICGIPYRLPRNSQVNGLQLYTAEVTRAKVHRAVRG